MKYTNQAVQVLAAQLCGLITSNADFWKRYSTKEALQAKVEGNKEWAWQYEELMNEFCDNDSNVGIICAYDRDFPFINPKVTANSEKPYLLFYRGDLSLLDNLNRNVAVIGLTDPDEEIRDREKKFVTLLNERELVVVSGLAAGCDSIAHEVTLDEGGRTVAILPSSLQTITPAHNRMLAERIVEEGGLVITEYYGAPSSKQEALSRFVNRDRLQAMFSKVVILTASYRHGEGDSGSRHAMESARKYGLERYVMYDEERDQDNPKFGLNQDFVKGKGGAVKVLHAKSIADIDALELPHITGHEVLEQGSLKL